MFPAEYKLILHHPYERWRPGPAKDPFWTQAAVTLDIASPGYAIANASIECTWTNWPWWIEPTQTALRLAVPVGVSTVEDPLFSAFWTAVGVSVTELFGEPRSAYPYFNGCWDDPHSTFPTDERPPTSAMPDYAMYPVLWESVRPALAECDAYGPSGYIGRMTRADAMEVVGEKFAGDFWRRRG